MNKKFLVVLLVAVILLVTPTIVFAMDEDGAPIPGEIVGAEDHYFVNWLIESKYVVGNGNGTVTVPEGAVPPGAQLTVDTTEHMGPSAGPAGDEQWPLVPVLEINMFDGDGNAINPDMEVIICVYYNQAVVDLVDSKPGHTMYLARSVNPLEDMPWAPLSSFKDADGMARCSWTRYVNGYYTLIEY